MMSGAQKDVNKLTIDKKFVGTAYKPTIGHKGRYKELTDSIWLIPGENPGM